MKTNIITNNTIMRNVVKYLCAVLLLIGTSASAWATTGINIQYPYNGSAYYYNGDEITIELELVGSYVSGNSPMYLKNNAGWTKGKYNYYGVIHCAISGTYVTSLISFRDDILSGRTGYPYFDQDPQESQYSFYEYNSINGGHEFEYIYFAPQYYFSAPGTYTSTITVVEKDDDDGSTLQSATITLKYVVTADCTERTLSFANATVNKTYGVAAGKYQNYTLSAGAGTVQWSAEPSSVATINSTNGTVYIAGAGTATITATVGENGVYCGASGSYTLNVAAVKPILSSTTAGKLLTVSNITSTGASFSGAIVTNKGGAALSSYGYIVGTSADVTYATAVKKTGTNSDIAANTKFGSKSVTDLTPNTTYYVRPIANNSAGIGYGEAVEFMTPQRYTITYNNNTGEGSIDNEYKDHGATVSLNAGTNFSKTGYTLSRWATNSGGGGTSYDLSGSYSGNDNLALFAIWTANPYTISLDNQNATSSGSTSIAVTYDASTNLTGTPAITVPTKTGYDFGGYYTGMNGGGSQIIAENGNVNASVEGFTDGDKKWIYTNNITLYAKWIAKTISLTLNKNNEDASGSSSGSATVKFDATALESGTTHASRSEWNLVGYYAEVGTTTKVLESSGAFAASDVSGYITDGKWSRTTDVTLYAKWSKTTYTVTFNMHGHGSEDDQIVESGSTAAQPANPIVDAVVDGWRFKGWFTDNGSGSASNTEFNFSTAITANTTVHAKWEEITYSNVYKAWCEPDITISGDIHLTTTKDVYIYATSDANNLIRIQSNDLAGVNKIALKYLDADNDDAEVDKGESPFRFCNDGSSNYNVADGSEINVAASNTCDLTYSIKYTPTAYGVTHHYKLQFTLKRNSDVLKTVTHDIYGRSLPEEFVIAVKKDGNWYALPNTLAGTQGAQNAITPIRITVNNTTTPETATYAPEETIYKGTGRDAATSNINGIRFTNDGSHWLQTSSVSDVYQMWLSGTNSDDDQVWYLKSTNFQAYTLAMDPSHSPTKKMGLYDGLTMGYHGSPTSSAIYLLPVTHKVEEKNAKVTEWGQKSVILDVDAQDFAGAQAHIGNDAAVPATYFKQTTTSVAKLASKYNYTLSFAALDFSEHKGELLYVDWLDSESEVVSTSTIEIPWIIAKNSVMGKIDNVQAHWKDWEVHVLPDVTLEADGNSFSAASNVAKINTLEIYPGATVKVTSGTLDVKNLIMRNGWTRANGKSYDVARLFIKPTDGNMTITNAYADWYIDYDQYYPVAVPWSVTTSGMSYKNSNVAVSAGVKMRYYDGASRAENGQAGVGSGANWKVFSRKVEETTYNYPETLTPGIGYAMTAKRPAGKAFSIIRMPLTIPSAAWTTSGEKGEVNNVHKDTVRVTAHGANQGKPTYTVGWNFIANPYMSLYKGAIGDIRYVNIPDLEFQEYGQYSIDIAGDEYELLPASGFFIQAASTETLTFGTTNRKAIVPSYRKDVETPTFTEQKAYITLSKEEKKDMMGLIIGEKYTAEYEINADLEKLLGSGTSLRTYMLYGGMNMAYLAINDTLAKKWIPVTVRIPEAGEYTFSITNSSIVDELEGVYLIDYSNGEKVTNLMEQDYTFSTPAGTISGRFALNAIVGPRDTPTPVDALNGGTIDPDKPYKFLYHEKVYILYHGVIYDAVGKKVSEINK